jgi:N-acetylglucosamine malate deacetylase 1
MKKTFGKSICIIAPHPDDEVLGLGGTIRRMYLSGIEVHLLIVSGHLPPLYSIEIFKNTRKECDQSSKILGISSVKFLKIPATNINQQPIADLNGQIKEFLDKIKPTTVFIPFPDRHIDHKLIFEASMVCTRPVGENYPKLVLSYETLSETDWNAPYIEPMFIPELFVDITDTFEYKLDAMKAYKSQLKNAPSRSLEAIEALARYRGSQNGFKYAEGFKVIRHLI